MLTYLSAVVAVAAIALTYLFCIRPMRRGNACFDRTSNGHDARGLELERVRAELELLRQRQRQRERAESSG